jgi:PII-like signaling protein
MVTVIDTEHQIQKLIPYLDKMIEGGLIAISSVEAIRYSNPTQEPSVIG